MQPTTSFWDNFSSEGRVKKLWAEALRETDPQKSLALLRSVRQKLYEPPSFIHLWLPFLDTFLARERVQNLHDDDLADVEKMGRSLQHSTNLREASLASVIWQRVIEAYNVRGEYKLACNLAEKLYKDSFSDEKTRAYCIRELARQKMIDGSYAEMYVAYLRNHSDPQKETEIFQVLDTLFTLDFRTSDERLISVNRTAQSLLALSIPTLPNLLPHLQSSRGLYALFVKAAPEEARDHFERAYQLNNTDRLAALGLLACEMRLGRNIEVTRLVQNSSLRALLHDPDIATLLVLHRLIQWLDQLEVPGPLPLDASVVTRLATFPLQRCVGDMAVAALGRFYLLIGDAQSARTQFDLLMKNTLKIPQWGYYAAWTYALCGDVARVLDCFERLASWPGRWTIACILLDQDLRLAEQSGALALLKNIAATDAPAAPVIKSRLALAQTATPVSESSWIDATYSLEEALEVLRTGLAQALTSKDLETAARLVTRSSFARLPLADQTYWLGLVERDQTRSFSLLVQAAEKWQHRRAALLLLVRSLRQGNWSQAIRYQEQALVGRTDVTAQLIRLYVDGRQAHLDDALQQGEQLAALGEERAYYILGNLYFYQAATYQATAEPQETRQAQQARLHAALAWQRLLATGQKKLPKDLPALSACASFIAYPQQRATSALTLIQNFQELDPVLRQPWLEWHVMLALLWYGTPQALSAMYTTMLNIAEIAGRADDSSVTTLALAMTRFVHRLKEGLTTQQFLELLKRFVQQSSRSASKQVLSSMIVAGQRALYVRADEHQRAQIEEDLRHHLERDPRNGLLILWQISIALHNNKGKEATELLQNASPEDPTLAYLLQELLNLLNDTPPAEITSSLNEQLTDLSRDVLNTARAIASNRREEAYDLLLRQSTSQILATWRWERILPSLCLYIQQKGITPPAFLTHILHSWRPTTEDGEVLLSLARCASILGNIEDACQLWEEALHNSTNDEHYTAWRQDFVRFLCRQAVSEYTAGQSLEAAGRLRLAARWTMPEFGRQLSQSRLLEHARILELRAVTALLLTYLFPDFDNKGTSLGRYHALGLTLARSPQLIEALISRDRERIQLEWKKTLQAQHDNMQFLHTLSVLYREVALSKQEQHMDIEKDWMTSTTLWILLLSTEAFWQYFTEERGAGEQDEPRKLSAQQRDELWQDALDNILVFHSNIARKSLAAGEHTQARIHARCLALGRQSSQYLVEQLERVDLVFPVNIEQKRLERIRSQTQRLLNEWGQSLLTEAEQSVEDVNSIEQLPRGIRKNYAGGIKILEAFIRLNVSLPRILLACLDWYNEWCSDLSLNGTRVQYRETTEAADMVCKKLQRLCDKRNAYAAENQAIALYLVYRGHSLVNLEPKQAIHFYEEAIAWGSSNPNLGDMLDKARLQNLEETAVEYANNRQFEKAYEAITQAETLIKQQDAVRNLRMRICFRHARDLETQGQYTEAWSRGRQALALVPTNTVLQQFVREIEELIPEESYAQSFHLAEQALEKQDFAGALQQLARIPAGSRLFTQVQDMRKQVLQQQKSAQASKATADEEPMDEKKLAEREVQLRLILEPGSSSENRAKAREELAVLLALRASQEMKQARLISEQQSELRRSRLIYARSLAEEASELDPRNTVAKQTLGELKKLLEPAKEEKKEPKKEEQKGKQA